MPSRDNQPTPAPSDSLKLENQLCFPLYACSKELIRHYHPYLKKLKLTYTQYIVMLFLWQQSRPVTVTALGEALFLDSGTLTPVLQKLETKGYLSRARSTKDRRHAEIALTPSGQALKDQAIDIPNEIGKCLGLTQEEGFTLYQLTYKIINNFKKEPHD